MSRPLEPYVETAAALLELELSPEAQAAVAANLANLERLAGAFADVELSDELEPAPVYQP